MKSAERELIHPHSRDKGSIELDLRNMAKVSGRPETGER